MLAALGYEPVGHAASDAALAAFRAVRSASTLRCSTKSCRETTGSELAVAIHENRAPDLPIVLMTGYPGAIPTAAAASLSRCWPNPVRCRRCWRSALPGIFPAE